MTNTKTNILLTSGALVIAATTLGVLTAMFGNDAHTIVRLTTISGILGTGSIGLFFVGLAFPKEQPVTESSRAIKD